MSSSTFCEGLGGAENATVPEAQGMVLVGLTFAQGLQLSPEPHMFGPAHCTHPKQQTTHPAGENSIHIEPNVGLGTLPV